MNEPTYICLSGGETFYFEDELHICSSCGEKSCPTCGSEVASIQEYEDNIRENQEKIDKT